MSADPSDSSTRLEKPQVAPSGAPHAGMMVTERVRLVRPLGKGGMADVWVADHATLGVSVAVKFLRYASDDTMRQRFSREAQLAARMDHPHAVRIFDHGLTPDGTPFMVMELIDGEALSQRIRRVGALSTDDVVTIVDQVAQVMAAAHRDGIVHRDLKPHNIMLLNTERLFCKVLDFGLAKPLEDEDVTLTQAGWLVGTPAYMAPEQLVDAKPATTQTDAWALAVIAYECLTGQRPFLGQHQAAIGLGMLLQRYEPVTKLRPALPPTLDEWFQRAFSVQPEQRFATVSELADTFSRALRGVGLVAGVPDGKLRLPNKLYGREQELAALDAAFDVASKGRGPLVLLEGYAGVGKTALADAARTRFSERGAIFVDGKFDQFNRGTPYASLIQAFGKLMRFISAREQSSIVGWRGRLQEAIGDVGQVLTEVIPELEDVVGPQAELTETSPTDARHRMQNAFARLVRGVATAERPLVMFLDDLQWADLPSLDLLASLAADAELRHVLVIGAFRDNEVDSAHPLRAAVTRVRDQGGRVQSLRLRPLGEDAVLELLSDVLGPGPGRVRLAVLCHEKTQGNPFFLRRLLEALHEDGMLVFDPDSRVWSWDSSKIMTRPLGDDVVDFVAAEMKRLPDEAREALTVAACIGGEFDLGTLAFLLRVDRRRALEALRASLAADFVMPASEDVFQLGPQRMAFRFAHDRIQQAARSLVDEVRAAKIHLDVAQFMLEHLDENEREGRLFELVEHLNRGADGQPGLVGSVSQLRSLNLSAARRATRSAAFEPAEEYFARARALTDESLWQLDYEEAFAIHVEGARSAYLNGDRETMQRLVDVAVAHARDAVDAAEAREVHIQALVAEQKFAEAVGLALDVLEELDVKLPRTPTDADVSAAVGEALELLRHNPLEAIVRRAPASSRRVIAAQRIKQGVMAAAYLTAPGLLPLLAASLVRSTLVDGVAKQSAYGFAAFGMVMNAIGLIDVSYENGRTALALLDRTQDRLTLPKTRHIVRAHLNPFVEPIGESVEHERDVFQLSMDNGDLEYAAWALHIMVAHAFYAGRGLAGLRDMGATHREILVRTRQLPALGCTLPFVQAVECCLGAASDPTRLRGPDYDEDTHGAELEAVNFRGAAYILTVAKTFVRFLFRDLDGALVAADAGARFADGAVASFHPVWWHQYRALAELGTADADDDLTTVRASLEQLRKWCGFSEKNHRHRVALVEAELARVEGRDGEAVARYDEAVAAARSNGFVHEEGIANELAGRYYLARGGATAARAYLREALDAYAEWGASAKVAQLNAELGHVLERAKRD